MMKLDKSLLGKRVKVFVPQTFHKGSKITTEATYIVGECTFAGFNWIVGKRQITVDRTPIFPVREEDVEVLS